MSQIAFEEVWARVRALETKTIPLAARGSMQVIRVDHHGLIRQTSTGRPGRMSIDSFKWAVNALNDRDHVSRQDILSGIRRWESSGVVAVLAATDLYEITHDPHVGLRVRH